MNREGGLASPRDRRPSSGRSLARDVLAWAGLGLAVLATLWPIGFTNRVLAGLDAFTYFEPYWALRNAALSSGHLPLWNPYIFLGVPFLANPQAAVLYPLHWPLVWLRSDRALIWSALFHVWLAAGFTYTYARRSLRVSRSGAWLAGLLFGLGGFSLARVENINQLNAAAWLPAMLWLYDETARSSSWRSAIRWGVGLSAVVALQILAGHTQTAYVNLVGLLLYAGYAPAKQLIQRIALRRGQHGGSRTAATASNLPPAGEPQRGGRASGLTSAGPLLPLLAILPGLLLVAAQLLPSMELNQLGLRTGGLSFRQAVSFSLQPRLLAQSFLPPFGGELAAAFSSEGYAEYLAYIGITGLVLAGIATIRIARSWGILRPSEMTGADVRPSTAPLARSGALILLALGGAFLALGAFNPFYYLFWRLVPGFAMFRAPVRWLELTALALAALAGIGLDAAGRRTASRSMPQETNTPTPVRAFMSRPALGLALLVMVGIVALSAFQQWPGVKTVSLWLAVTALACAGLWAAGRWAHLGRGWLLALALLELWVASRALPFTLATAPFVLSLRNAPATLLAQMAEQSPAGRERFLSLSDIRYDPGDLSELRDLMADDLPPDAIERLVRGAKQTDVIAPNLSLRLQLPGVDGYDGGLLPTNDYSQLQSLFLPAEQRLADGRLREQLRQIPAGRLLDLTGVRFVLTDKQNDLWAENVYYDLEQAATLKPGEGLELDLASYPRFSATGLGIVSYLTGAVDAGTVVAEFEVRAADGRSERLPVRAGRDTAPGQEAAGSARVARSWPEWTGAEGQDYLGHLDLAEPLEPVAITVRAPPDAQVAFVLRGLSLLDQRTGAHTSVTVSPEGDFRRIHSGDVKIYEREGAPGRAWLVHGVQPVADGAQALQLLANPTFDARRMAAVEAELQPQPPASMQTGEAVEVLEFSPERVRLKATASQPAMLVLADAFYPGWRATVDGAPAPVLRADLMLRGVALSPGSHEVVFSYQPSSWRWGAAISLLALALLAGAFGATFVPVRRCTPDAL